MASRIKVRDSVPRRLGPWFGSQVALTLPCFLSLYPLLWSSHLVTRWSKAGNKAGSVHPASFYMDLSRDYCICITSIENITCSNYPVLHKKLPQVSVLKLLIVLCSLSEGQECG